MIVSSIVLRVVMIVQKDKVLGKGDMTGKTREKEVGFRKV